MTEITYSVHLDWLACTFSESPGYPAHWPSDWVDAHAFHSYSTGRKAKDGRLEMINPDRPDMGIHVQATGDALARMREHSTDAEIASWALSARNISRLDVAVNAQGLQVDVVKILKSYEDGAMRTKARKAPKIYKHGNKEGQGIYIGNRAATHCVIYDKAQQLQLKGEHWTRVEFRVTGDRARQVARMLAKGEDVRPVINAWVSLPKEVWWCDMMTRAVSPLEPVPAKDTDTVRWLLGTAAPTLGREMALDDDLLMRFLEVVYAVREEQISNDRNTA